MGNLNAVAVASLADAAAIVLCHGATLMPDALARARTEGINVFATDLPEYEACVAFAREME